MIHRHTVWCFYQKHCQWHTGKPFMTTGQEISLGTGWARPWITSLIQQQNTQRITTKRRARLLIHKHPYIGANVCSQAGGLWLYNKHRWRMSHTWAYQFPPPKALSSDASGNYAQQWACPGTVSHRQNYSMLNMFQMKCMLCRSRID